MQNNRTIFLCCVISGLFLGIYAAEPVQNSQKACSRARIWQWIGNYYGFPSTTAIKDPWSDMPISQTPKLYRVSDLPEPFSWIKPWTWHWPKSYNAVPNVVYGEKIQGLNPIKAEIDNLLIPVVTDSNAPSGFRVPSSEDVYSSEYGIKRNPVRRLVSYGELFKKELDNRTVPQGFDVAVCDLLEKNSEQSRNVTAEEQLMQIKEEKSLLKNQQKILSNAQTAAQDGVLANLDAIDSANDEWKYFSCDTRLFNDSLGDPCRRIAKNTVNIFNKGRKLERNYYDIRDARIMLFNRENALRQRSRAIKNKLPPHS
jgi:hypothetical protein